jgi:hypothetical protein
MSLEPDLKRRLFRAVLQRVRNRSDSLVLFYSKWHGKAGGFQDWLKVEAVAAVEETLARVSTGGSGGRGKRGSFPDLKLTFSSGQAADIELKVGTEWNLTGGDRWEKHRGRLLIFLCPHGQRNLERSKEQLCHRDAEYFLEKVCAVTGPSKSTDEDFYLGLVDLS